MKKVETPMHFRIRPPLLTAPIQTHPKRSRPRQRFASFFVVSVIFLLAREYLSFKQLTAASEETQHTKSSNPTFEITLSTPRNDDSTVFLFDSGISVQSSPIPVKANLRSRSKPKSINKDRICPPKSFNALIQPRKPNNKLTETKPCALLFFGLPKQFKSLVLPSIEKNIIRYNAECDVFAHTYNVESVSSRRNNEDESPINSTEILHLTHNVIIETNQEFEATRNLSYYRQDRFFPQGTTWEFPTSMDNMIKQWHSIERAWDLMEEFEMKNNVRYERVGLFRSDVLYVTPVRVMDKEEAVTPLFSLLGVANDRMFYGSYKNAKIWAKVRFPSADCYKSKRSGFGLHSEYFMKDLILPQMAPSRVIEKDICFFRVRATGVVLSDDCWCFNDEDVCASVRNQSVVELVSSIVNKTCAPGESEFFTFSTTQCPV